MAVAKPRIIGPSFKESWQEHFNRNGWTTLEQKLNAGYPKLLQPNPFYGTWVFVHDYGAIVAASLVRLSYVLKDIVGQVPVVTDISYSDDAVAWTEETDVSQIYAVSFRYVRVRFRIGIQPAGTPIGLLLAITRDPGGASDKNLVSIEAIRLRLDVKEIDDGGIITANASDVSGTSVTFNKTFVDVRDLVATPLGLDSFNLPFESAVVFDDDPNPTGFSVYVWNSAGARATAQVSWRAKGV